MEARLTTQRASTNGLVFSMPMTGGFTSGATLYDESGGGFTGTAVNSPTPRYPGFYFDTSKYIDIGAGPAAVNTVLAWIKMDTAVGSSIASIDLNGTDYIYNTDAVLSYAGFAGGTVARYIDGVSANTGLTTAWHMIGLTDTVAKNATDFDIGRLDANYFDGLISDVRLYNRVLSKEEILSIYSIQKYKYQT